MRDRFVPGRLDKRALCRLHVPLNSNARTLVYRTRLANQMRRWLSYKPISKFSNNNSTGSGASSSGKSQRSAWILTPPGLDEPSTQTVTYERRSKVRDGAVNDSGLRFDASVPVKTIAVKDPAIEAIPENLREVIGEKVSYRLAQQPGSHWTPPGHGRAKVRRATTSTFA